MLTALSVKIIHDLLASFCYNQLIMTLKTFFNFTRIQTLPAALLSPIAGCLFALWYFKSFHFWPTFFFFIGLASINLFVSALNNLMDYQKALDPEYKKWNIIVAKSINPKLALNICLALLAIDVVVGLIVLFLTNLAILPIGGLCFLIAIFYTYGPFAFSRFPSLRRNVNRPYAYTARLWKAFRSSFPITFRRLRLCHADTAANRMAFLLQISPHFPHFLHLSA